MAVAATVEVSPPFEPGTTVQLWRSDTFPGEGPIYEQAPPPGAVALQTVTVTSAGNAQFPGLEPETKYVTGAQVPVLVAGPNPSIRNVWRYISFISVPELSPGGGGGGEGPEGKEGPQGVAGPRGEFNYIPGGWFSGTTYAKGDAVTVSGSTYASIKDLNVEHNPVLEGEWWKVIAAKGATGGGGGGGSSPPFVDITKFTYEGVEYGYSEAMSIAGEEGAVILQKAIERAVQLGGVPVSTSQPWNQVWIEKLYAPTYNKPYSTLLEGRKGTELFAGVHIHGGASLQNIKLKIGGKAATQVEERRASPESLNYAIAVDKGSAFTKANLENVEVAAPTNNERWNENKNLLTENPKIDGLHAGGKGVYRNLTFTGAIRFGMVNASNHTTYEGCTFGGAYKIGYVNCCSGGARTGNTTFKDCNFQGGGGWIFLDSGCSISGMYFYRGWYGFGSKLPLIYKPKTGTKTIMIGSLKMIHPQFEGGHGPLAYNEDGESRITNWTMIQPQLIGSDPPMGGPGPTDVRLGAGTGNAVDAFIKCSKMSNCQVPIGAMLAASGWGGGSTIIIAGSSTTGNLTECDFGDCTVALQSIRFRGKPFVITKEVAGVKMRTANKNGETANVVLAYSATSLTEGQVVRYTTSSKQDYAVRPSNQEGATAAGLAYMTINAEQWAPIVVKSPDRPFLTNALVSTLGAGEGEAGIVPPLARGGESTLASAFVNGPGIGSAHTPPTVLWGCAGWSDSVFLDTLADLATSEATVAVNGKFLLTYREARAAGSSRTVSLKLTKGEPLAKINSGGVTGLTPGLFVTGTGIPKGTIIQVVDPANNLLLLSNNASANEAASSCTVECPTACLMGAVPNNATHLTETVEDAGTLKGSGTLKVERTNGFPSSGTVQMELTWVSGAKAKRSFTYTSKDATSFKGVTYTGTLHPTLYAGQVVTTLSPPKAANKSRILRAMNVASIGGEHVTYNGEELTPSATTPQNLDFNELTSFPASGLAVFTAETTLVTTSIEKGPAQKIKVASTASFPLGGGKLEIGKNAVLTYSSGGILNSTEVEGNMKVSQAHRTRIEGEPVVLAKPIEISYEKRSSSKLEGAVVVGGGAPHAIRKGMRITAILFNPAGGVLEATSSGQLYTYKGTLESREKQWLVGVVTPERGSNLAESAAIKNLTVLQVTSTGVGFAVGPASAQVHTGAHDISFPYERFIGVTASETEEEAPADEEEGGEEEEQEGTSDEEEVAAESGTRGYFIGVGAIEGTGGSGAAGAYSGGVLTRATVQQVDDNTIKVTDTRLFPSKGTLKIGNTSANYTAVEQTESSRTGKVKSGAKTITGVSSLTNVVAGTPLQGNGLTGLQVLKAESETITLNNPIGNLTLTVTGTAKSGALEVTVNNSETIVLEAGQEVFGTGIPAGTTISEVVSPTKLKLSAALTEDLSGSMLVRASIVSETFQVLLGTFTGVTWAEGSEKKGVSAGKPVTLYPARNTTEDKPLRVAYGTSGRSGVGDVGVGYTPASGTEGATVGYVAGEDDGCLVPVILA